MAIDLEKFGNRLAQVRRRKKFSQTALAEIIGVDQRQVSRWETGQEPLAGVIYDLALALDVSADWLLGLSDEDQ